MFHGELMGIDPFFMAKVPIIYVLLVKIEGPVWFIIYLLKGVVSNPSILGKLE